MMRPNLLLMWVLLMLFTADLFSGESVGGAGARWRAKLESRGLEEVVRIAGMPEGKDWPVIYDDAHFGIAGVGREECEQRQRFVLSFIDSLEAYALADQRMGLAEFQTSMGRMLDAASEIRKRGWLVNAAVSDALRRVVVMKISEKAIGEQASRDAAALILERMGEPEIDVPKILKEFQKEDSDLDGLQIKETVDREVAVAGQIVEAGVPEKYVIKWMLGGRANGLRGMVRGASAIQLILDSGSTPSKARAVRGMIRYIELGGTLEEAELTNFPKFQKIMGEEVYKYGARENGVYALNDGNLWAIVKLHRGEEALKEREQWAKWVFGKKDK